MNPYEIGDSRICLYAKEDLLEFNETYQIEQNEPNFFMIGQEGYQAYFIKKIADDSIYENDLGALGSIEMKKVVGTINDFIERS